MDAIGHLKTYAKWKPTQYDCAGLGLEDRQDWYVGPCIMTRDSDALERSNWDSLITILDAHDTGEDYEVHRFGHWGPGWFAIVLLRPDTRCALAAAEGACALAGYPVLDDEKHSEYEQAEADQVWRDCYSPEQRIDYIRRHRSQFEFHRLVDMLGCVRGHYFAGYASELIA